MQMIFFTVYVMKTLAVDAIFTRVAVALHHSYMSWKKEKHQVIDYGKFLTKAEKKALFFYFQRKR